MCVRERGGGEDLIYLTSAYHVDKEDFELLVLLPPTPGYRQGLQASARQMLCGAGDKTQIPMHTRQTSYQQNHILSPHPHMCISSKLGL